MTRIGNLYAKHERVAVEFETGAGDRFCMVLVAATNVCNIKLRFDSAVSTELHAPSGQAEASEFQPAVALTKGSEVGLFAMGSTVVLLLEKKLCDRIGASEMHLSALVGKQVRVGGAF